jgi:hypothetical protein
MAAPWLVVVQTAKEEAIVYALDDLWMGRLSRLAATLYT